MQKLGLPGFALGMTFVRAAEQVLHGGSCYGLQRPRICMAFLCFYLT